MTVIAYRNLFLIFACFFLCTQITLIGGIFWVGSSSSSIVSSVSSTNDIKENLLLLQNDIKDLNENLNILQFIQLHSAYVDGDAYIQDIEAHLKKLTRSRGGRRLDTDAVQTCQACTSGVFGSGLQI